MVLVAIAVLGLGSNHLAFGITGETVLSEIQKRYDSTSRFGGQFRSGICRKGGEGSSERGRPGLLQEEGNDAVGLPSSQPETDLQRANPLVLSTRRKSGVRFRPVESPERENSSCLSGGGREFEPRLQSGQFQ